MEGDGAPEGRAGPLSAAQVAEIVTDDLHRRGSYTPKPDHPLSDESWIDLVHATYYRGTGP